MSELSTHETSVQALINDLKHVVSNVDPTAWAETARTVRQHHTPAIADSVLSPSMVGAQQQARELLDHMVVLEDDSTLWESDDIRDRLTDVQDTFTEARKANDRAHRPIFDLSDSKRVTSPTFVPAEPRVRRMSALSGLFSRRES